MQVTVLAVAVALSLVNNVGPTGKGLLPHRRRVCVIVAARVWRAVWHGDMLDGDVVLSANDILCR